MKIIKRLPKATIGAIILLLSLMAVGVCLALVKHICITWVNMSEQVAISVAPVIMTLLCVFAMIFFMTKD